MSKIVIEDIKKERRSLRDVIPTKHSDSEHQDHRGHHNNHRSIKKERDDEPEPIVRRKLYHQDNSAYTESSLSWLWGLVLIAGIVVLTGYFVAPLFTKVNIAIIPKEMSISVAEKIEAFRKTDTDELTFAVLPEINKTISLEMPASGNKYTESKASGKIRIINNFSSDSQTLVATTRFTSSKGKVYRIANTINVPGIRDGKPGTIEVTVYADQAGSDYNEGLTNFTIPGFAGSPKFDKITAQSITPMTGGIIGNIKVVDSVAEAEARKQLKDQLETVLVDEVTKNLPDGFFVNKDTINLNYDIVQVVKDGSAIDKAIFEAKGSALAIMFNKDKFTEILVKEAVGPESAKNPINIADINQLKFEILPDIKTVNPSSIDKISINITGKAHFVWKIDQNKLKNQLLGKPKEDFAEVFKSYGESIVSGKVSFKPSWSKKFPTNIDKIDINLPTSD